MRSVRGIHVSKRAAGSGTSSAKLAEAGAVLVSALDRALEEQPVPGDVSAETSGTERPSLRAIHWRAEKMDHGLAIQVLLQYLRRRRSLERLCRDTRLA